MQELCEFVPVVASEDVPEAAVVFGLHDSLWNAQRFSVVAVDF